jgi:hypothetical protein
MLRLALAFAALVLLPGAAFVAMGLRPPGGAWLSATWALGFGVAWNAALVVVTILLRRPFTMLLGASPFITALLWVIAWRLDARRATRPGPRSVSGPLRGIALALVLAAAALAAIHAGRTGAVVSYYGDSPDHIGTIRRMIETGDAFPDDAFFRDAGRAGADPRKGLWHAEVALVTALAKVDPADAWLQLPAVIAPLFVLNVALLGWLSAAGTGAAVFAWVQLVVLAGSMQWFPLRKAMFATFLADQLALATAIAVLADLRRPSRAGRVAAVILGLGAIAAHVFSALQFAITLGALTVGLAVRDRAWRGAAARAFGTALAVGLASLPYLIWRERQSYAPVNIIHTEPQGLLTLFDSQRVVSIGVLWDWMGTSWILFPLLAWSLWRHGRRDPAALYALTTATAVGVVMFVPPVVAVLAPKLGYLLMRMIWMVPLSALVGWTLIALGRAVRARAGAARLRAAAGLAALLVFLAPTARDAAATLVDPQRFVRGDRDESPLRWRAPMAWMDAHLPPGQVILSDPATSYGVPMLTRHYVATLVDQHSSPSDSLALARILDARDALDPYSSWERTREVVRRWGVTAIVLNADFPRVPTLDYWAPSPGWVAAARARLARAPAAFERVYDAHGFAVYRIHRAALDTLSGAPAPRPFVTPYVPGAFPIARRYAPDLPVVQQFALWPSRVARGDTLSGVIGWRALSRMPGGSYHVSVRFDQPLPGGFVPPAAVGKPARKILERLRHERWRFRADHLPTAGVYGVDLWKPDEVVRDSFQLAVPGDVAPGYYRVEVRMNRGPHYPNLRLSDYFFDRDYFSGVVMGAIEVVPTRAALALPPAPPPAEFLESH